MVPLKLKLRNFMSYGEDVSPLDFAEFNLACLSGQNGHGKSALLDAITWALWGEARKARGRMSPDEDLVRIGAQDMDVEFEFEVEGNKYRVIRRYSRKLHRRTSLELHIYSPEENLWKPLTGKSHQETQKRINSILHMDYETFIASSFILQGRADEFTKRTPGERKEILASILGLDHYEQLSQLAREHQKDCLGQIQVKWSELERIESELRELPQLEKVARELEERLSKVNEELQVVVSELEDKRKQLATLEERSRQLQELRRQARELYEEIKRAGEEYNGLLEQYNERVRFVNQRGDEIEGNYKRYLEAVRRNEELSGKLNMLRELEAQKRRIEKAIEEAKAGLEKGIAGLQERYELLRKEALKAKELIERGDEIERGYGELEELKREDERLEGLRKRHLELHQRGVEIKAQIDVEWRRLEAELKAILRRCEELEPKAKRTSELKARVSELREKLTELQKAQDEAEGIKGALMDCERRSAELIANQRRLEDAIEDVKTKLSLLIESTEPRCPVCSSPLDEHRKRKLKAEFELSLDEMQRELSGIDSEKENLGSERMRLQSQLKHLEEKIKLMGTVQKQLADAEAKLNEAEDAFQRMSELRSEAEKLRQRIESEDYAIELRKQLEAVREEMRQIAYNGVFHEQLKKRLESMRRYETEMEMLKQAVQRLSELQQEIEQVEIKITKLRTKVDSGDFAQSERMELAQLNELIVELGYDGKEHEMVRKEQKELEIYVELHEELMRAKAELPQLKKQLEMLKQSISNWKKKFEETSSQIKAYEEEMKSIPELKSRVGELEKKYSHLDAKRSELQSKKGEVEGKIARCKELENERTRIDSELSRLRHEERIYGLLFQAFGKDGIQALIIENAVSEIEDEANKILSKLTHNRAHVAFELQRETKSGATRETLEIKVADELGTRPYELYSGGESFRIDFAIRVALAKLLARRSGTRLRFLVIDEGFGSQDADGLRQMVEAINDIKSEFDKILVVTHLEQLKDAFPTRIEVTKDPHLGSRFEVIHL